MAGYTRKWWRRLTTGKTPIKWYVRESRSWRTCAVAEARMRPLGKFIAVEPEGFNVPQDPKLFELGAAFEQAVSRNARSRARRIYRRIMARVNQLAKEHH